MAHARFVREAAEYCYIKCLHTLTMGMIASVATTKENLESDVEKQTLLTLRKSEGLRKAEEDKRKVENHKEQTKQPVPTDDTTRKATRAVSEKRGRDPSKGPSASRSRSRTSTKKGVSQGHQQRTGRTGVRIPDQRTRSKSSQRGRKSNQNPNPERKSRSRSSQRARGQRGGRRGGRGGGRSNRNRKR